MDGLRIRDEAMARGITRLCHITQSRKLPHIFGSPGGLYSTNWLEKNRPDLLDRNDPLRLDGQHDHISCSIEYPNTWYLGKIRGKDPNFPDWVVLFIRPDQLWRPGTLFCPRNAASGQGSEIMAGFAGFQRLFGQAIAGSQGITFKRSVDHLLSCPTDGQAEVLLQSPIERHSIFGVVTATPSQAILERQRLRDLGVNETIISSMKWITGPCLFDHTWHRAVSQGKSPPEVVLE